MLRKVFLVPLLLAVSSVFASAQTTQLRSSSSDRAGAVASGDRTSLTEELDKAVVEPRSQRFRMNIPFALAGHSTLMPDDTTVGHQYIWNNFSEGFIMLQYFEYPAGTIPTSPDAQKQWAVEQAKAKFDKAGLQTNSEKDIRIGNVLGKEFEGTFRGKKVTTRVFADGNVYYVLTALPVPEKAGPIIQKLFDSFEFVRQ